MTETVLPEIFEVRPQDLHASVGGECGRNRAQTQQCGACEPAEELCLMERTNKKRKKKKEDMSSLMVQLADGETGVRKLFLADMGQCQLLVMID